MSKLVTRKLTDTFANSSGTSFVNDDDPELIADALPFTIKLYESLIEKDSTNAALLLSTSKLLCLYTQYFVTASLDTTSDQIQRKSTGKRAKKLFLRSREYALKAIDIKKPGMKNALLKGQIDSTLKNLSPADSTSLFWIAASWLGAIGADKTDMPLAMGIKKPLALTRKIIEFNPTFYQGMAHELLGVASANLPKSLGGGLDTAECYFNKAIELSDSSRISTFFLYASLIAEKKNKKDLFISLLERADKIPIESFPQVRLQNVIYKQKSRVLLGTVNSLFPATMNNEAQSDTTK
jgi:hypothetical protein